MCDIDKAVPTKNVNWYKSSNESWKTFETNYNTTDLLNLDF